MKPAICIGHSRRIKNRYEGGAVSQGNVNERTYNLEVAKLIKKAIPEAVIFDKYEGNGYTSSILWLARQIKEAGCDLAVELHFNYFDGIDNGKGTGHEWLYWHTSKEGRRLALCFDKHAKALLAIPARGIISRASGRGAVFLENTHCPAVIGEPFFGDEDWFEQDPETVAKIYIYGIKDFYRK